MGTVCSLMLMLCMNYSNLTLVIIKVANALSVIGPVLTDISRAYITFIQCRNDRAIDTFVKIPKHHDR